MGFPDPDPGSGCRRHTKQKQQPGVCSYCLRERLTKLSSANSSYRTANSTPSSSLSSSPVYSAASSFSPVQQQRARHRRNGSDNSAAPVGFVLHEGGSSNGNGGGGGGGLGLKKSRSVACAPRIYRGFNGSRNGGGNGGEERRENGGGWRKGSGGGGGGGGDVGFWKKWINSTSKKTKGVLVHSNTVKGSPKNLFNSSSSSRKF